MMNSSFDPAADSLIVGQQRNMMTPQTFRFRFEFHSKEMAEAAIAQLRVQQFANSLKWSDESQKWVCTSTRTVDRKSTSIEKVHAYLYTLIEACDGTYRNHELIQENEVF